MAKTRLSTATYVTRGYSQVEPNHLSAQRTGQIYAQLPAAAAIEVLENGQFVKYDYANGVVDYTGAGEWMLVYNEVKLYRDHLNYEDFAMKKDDYLAYVYAAKGDVTGYENARDYSGITTPADQYEPDSTNDPFVVEKRDRFKAMPANTSMVPRVFKTNIGDIFTTNGIVYGASADPTLAAGALFTIDPTNGFLTAYDSTKDADTAATTTTSKKIGKTNATQQWQVVKIYTLPDRQKAVKLMRIA